MYALIEHVKCLVWPVGGLLLLVLVTSCDLLEPNPFEPEVVVESYQIAGEDLQRVRLSWTVPIDKVYDPEEQAVSGAKVRVLLVGEGGEIEAVYRYRESDRRPGVYVAEDPHTVRPLRRYRLEAEHFQKGVCVRAETRVPGIFDMLDSTTGSAVYDDNVEVTITPSEYPGRRGVYMFSSTSLDTSADALTPYYRDIYKSSGGTISLDDLQTGFSEAIREEELDRASDGIVHIDLRWKAVSFYGPNIVEVSAVDDNYYDFLRSQGIQQGGIGFAPGEIPNVLTHVEGGTGLFGSYARKTFNLHVDRPAAERKAGGDDR